MATTVLTDGKVEIPLELRRRWGLEDGVRLQWLERNGELVLVPFPEAVATRQRRAIDALSGIWAGDPNAPTADDIRKMRNEEAASDEP